MGATEAGVSGGPMPPGYHHVRRRAVLGDGRELFEQAAERLLAWELHRGAGLLVAASAERAAPGVTVVSALKAGPLWSAAPCRVLWMVATPMRAGFGYATLPGHPALGEEAFAVELARNGTVSVLIAAFSRPATWLTRLGGPVARLVQARITERYLSALRPA